ncbi:zinc-finger domain-containing protein [Amphibiibacter pelophylacis]|uniref:Zinc-finger domain-containing protein n=1 Tax=Amphibiibacter pelophylacis TaxID=1799477 RepID=A0ACC6P0P7_9BURK
MSTPTASPVIVTARELHGCTSVCCPNPSMTAWNSHPRVFIDISHTGRGVCPYCGTQYQLKEGEVAGGGH